MKFNLVLISYLAVFIAGIKFSVSQESAYFEPPQKTYREAIQLFEQSNYGAAQLLLEEFLRQVPDNNNVFHENASYYNAISAIHLKSNDAANLVKQFASTYPESAWMPSINFELGKLFYENNQYKQTLEAFTNVNPRQLNQLQRAEFYYKKGYCQLKLNQLDGALTSFSQVTKTNSDYAKPATYYSAHIEYEKGKYEKALLAFKAIENDKKYGKTARNYIIAIYFEQKKYNQVIEEGTSFLAETDSQSSIEITRLIANSYYELGNFQQALPYFEKYENSVKHPIEPGEQYRIGYVKFHNKQFKSAIGNFQKAISDNKSVTQNAWYYLGFCYMETGQDKFAQNAFLKSYKYNIDSIITTNALFEYIKITIELGGDPVNNPIGLLNKYIENNTDGHYINEAYDLLAQLYIISNKYQDALLSIESVKQPTNQLQSFYQQLAYNQAIEYMNAGKYQLATDYFSKALIYVPDKSLQAQTLYWYGDALYNLKEYTEAEKKFNQFFKIPGAKQTSLYFSVLYSNAYTAFNLKQYSVAADYFKKYIETDKSNPQLLTDAKLRLGDCYFILKNYNLAADWYQQVLNSGSTGGDYALYQLAFCNGAQGNFNQKINYLKSLVNKYKSSQLYTDALYEIASTNLAIDDQREAIVYFDKLVKEKPGSTLAKKSLVKIGLLYYNNNQLDLALTTLKQVVKNYPASPEANEALKTIQSIYIELAQVDQYFAYLKTLDFIQLPTSTEDSLTFVSAENYYLNGDCPASVELLEKYLSKFPSGGYVLLSYYYLTECSVKQNDQFKALVYYEKIIALPANQFTNKSLLQAARINFDLQNYKKSGEYYALLSESAENPGMIIEALDGAMRSAYLDDNIFLAEEYAGELLLVERISDQQAAFGHFIKAKYFLEKNDPSSAENEYLEVINLTSTEIGAESVYDLALIKFNKNQLDESEEFIYKIPEKYPESEYWIANGFILLADIYIARNNSFQAEQTLISVIENYPGDDLKEIANQKLKLLQSQEN